MPPDYPSKFKKSLDGKETERDRLESMEDNLYDPNKSPAQGETWRPSYGQNFSVRTDWAESQDFSKRSDLISNRNTFSVLKQILVGSIILFVASLAVAAYVFFGGQNVISTKNIVIGINMPPSIAGGENMPVEVNITNQNNVPLLSADVSVEYAAGGRQPDDMSKELRRYRESVGAVSVGGSINKKFNVVFFGEEGESKDVKVTLEYRVQGSNAIFSKTESRSVILSSAPVSVAIEALSEYSAGQDATISLTIGANSGETIKNLTLMADYPFGFSFSNSDPRPSYENRVWDLGDLKSGSTRVLKIQGQFSGAEGEEKAIRFSIGTRDPNDERKIGVVFLSKTQIVKVAEPFIGVDLALGGSRDLEYVTDAGRNVRGDIVFTNNLKTRITNVVVQAKLKGNIFDRKLVSTGNGFFRSTDNTILWDQTTSSQLGVLEPGAKGSVNFGLKILDSVLNQRASSMVVEVTILASSISSDSSVEQLKVTTMKTIKIASTLGVDAKIIYSSGPFQNFGSIPPQSDQETTYTVTLSVPNSSNDLSDVKVLTSLPIYVHWLDKISPVSEDLKYNPVGGEVVWNVGDINSGGGSRSVSFQVSFTPSLSQVGSSPKLLDDVTASGYDRFSSVMLTASKNSGLDIGLYDDPVYAGRGGPVK
jgi:hypothetical protein